MPDNLQLLLRAILSTSARQAFPSEHLAETVLRGGIKYLRAFNMCDGTMGQGEIAARAKLDRGNFSRTVARWIEAGIVFRLGEGREATLLHVYPLQEDAARRKDK
jgi:DNA-binding MarR family transcriptional regulator